MDRIDPVSAPPLPAADARLAALEALVALLERRLAATTFPEPTPIEDYSLRHLAKAAGTGRSALRLLRAEAWADACILIRAVFEQLFIYLWVVQDPAKAQARSVMITIKQEWANAKYLEGLARGAAPEAQAELLEGARAYQEVADRLLAELAEELGTTEKKVRDEANLRVSAKAFEVNLGPRYSVPYATYCGFGHSDGNALAAYGAPGPDGMCYGLAAAAPAQLPMVSDLHRALWRLVEEVSRQCPRLQDDDSGPFFAAQAAWLEVHDEAIPLRL